MNFPASWHGPAADMINMSIERINIFTTFQLLSRILVITEGSAHSYATRLEGEGWISVLGEVFPGHEAVSA
jgi:hypothetical protein